MRPPASVKKRNAFIVGKWGLDGEFGELRRTGIRTENDIWQCPLWINHAPQQTAPLFDHLVGQDKDRVWDRHPDRLRGSEIEDQVKLRGLFHG